jgi:hypothetical protein
MEDNRGPILEDQMNQPKPKKELLEVIPPTFQMLWASLLSISGGFRYMEWV